MSERMYRIEPPARLYTNSYLANLLPNLVNVVDTPQLFYRRPRSSRLQNLEGKQARRAV